MQQKPAAREPTVTLAANGVDHKDVFDVALGLRFHEGVARDVPLSVAVRIVNEHRGYHIPGALYTRKRKGDA